MSAAATIQALRQQLERGESGELRLVVAGGIGRVQIVDGRVAWVVSGAHGDRLGPVLQRHTGLSAAALRHVYRSCCALKRNFAEALVHSRLAEAKAVRAALVEHNARQLELLVDRGDAGTVAFSPIARQYAPDLTFTLEELIADVGPEPATGLYLVPDDSKTDGLEVVTVIDVMAVIHEALTDIMRLDGAIAAALVDWESGLTLGFINSDDSFDVSPAASGNTAVVRAKMAVMEALGLHDEIEDILITLQSQHHLIRPLTGSSTVFLYLAIDTARGNLGMARYRMQQIEDTLRI